MTTYELIEVFRDTQHRINNDAVLRSLTLDSIKATRLYEENFVASEKVIKSEGDNLSVIEGTTFDTARSVGEGKIATLSFANPYEAGGGAARGAVAQEECLCRCSNLYNALTADHLAENYYKWHKNRHNYLFSDKVIYTPNVQIIKSDDYSPLEKAFSVDVLTCAAPYNLRSFPEDVLKTTYESRITNILEVAIDNGADVLVLGAFGCGVFRNPASLMAEAFREILVDRGYHKYFKQVVFAIIASQRNKNLEIFKSVLSNN